MPNNYSIGNPLSFVAGFALQPNGSGEPGSNLQSTISAATSGVGKLPVGVSHHPITCTAKIYYDEDGVFSCEHGTVPSNDERTQAAVNHSLALMIIEEAFLNYTGMETLPYDRAAGIESHRT